MKRKIEVEIRIFIAILHVKKAAVNEIVSPNRCNIQIIKGMKKLGLVILALTVYFWGEARAIKVWI
jgi:hypothetical protein